MEIIGVSLAHLFIASTCCLSFYTWIINSFGQGPPTWYECTALALMGPFSMTGIISPIPPSMYVAFYKGGTHHYYHFMDEKTKAQRSEVT